MPPSPPVPRLLLLDSFSLFLTPFFFFFLLRTYFLSVVTILQEFFVLFCYASFLFFFSLVAVLSVSSVSLAIDDLAIILFLFL